MNLDAAQLELLADSLVDSHDKFLEDLVAMRKRHRLTQETVAERMGVSQPTVASFERYDANPTLSSIRRYALAVGASIQHVVEDSCCNHSEERFVEVFAGAAASWTRAAPLEWEWTRGQVVMDTSV